MAPQTDHGLLSDDRTPAVGAGGFGPLAKQPKHKGGLQRAAIG